MWHDISAIRGRFLLIFALECSPYFYFRSSWPTDLESVSRDAHLVVTVSIKFEVDTTIGCLVIALLLLIRYVTLWPWPLTFWLWSEVVHGGSRGQPLHQVWRSYGYPFLSYKFWHWQCLCSHCACAVSCDQCVAANFSHIGYLKSVTPICLFTI